MGDDAPDSPTPAFVGASQMLRRAESLARDAHQGQRRRDGSSPYISHLLEVAAQVGEAGLDEVTVAAALLHDVVEHAELRMEEVIGRFGVEVGEVVATLTDDRSTTDWEERKVNLRRRVEAAGARAAAIYAADRLVNLREMRDLFAELGEDAAERYASSIYARVRLWFDDLEMLDRVAPPRGLVDDLRRELEAFQRERAAMATRAGAGVG
jgi:(p)ppGpp synthase/HD superfamily hydrolase